MKIKYNQRMTKFIGGQVMLHEDEIMREAVYISNSSTDKVANGRELQRIAFNREIKTERGWESDEYWSISIKGFKKILHFLEANNWQDNSFPDEDYFYQKHLNQERKKLKYELMRMIK